MSNVNIASVDFKSIILSHKGQYLGISWIKKDGTERTVNGQVGVKEGHLGANPTAHIEKYVTVAENLGGGEYKYVNVNVETITRLAVGGKVYTKEN